MSVEAESLSSILSNREAPAEPVTDVKTEAAPSAAPEAAKDEPKAEATPTKAEPTAEEKSDAAKARDDKGRFQKAAKPEPQVPLSALLAERAKNRNRDAEPPKPKTSFLENEDQAFSERVNEHVNPLKETLFEVTVDFARERYEDFDEVAKVFTDAAEADERLYAAMRASRNPGKYIYQVGKQLQELAPFNGDVTRYKEHAIAETKAELAKAQERIKALEAETETRQKAKEALESIPRSLNSSGSAAAPKAEDEDPEDLNKIVRFSSR
jgi:hypothetical protein